MRHENHRDRRNNGESLAALSLSLFRTAKGVNLYKHARCIYIHPRRFDFLQVSSSDFQRSDHGLCGLLNISSSFYPPPCKYVGVYFDFFFSFFFFASSHGNNMEEKEEEENLSRVKEKPMILFFHALSRDSGGI